ncbi:MAG: 30S ribosomal protein S7 [Euryarchaeota archaeon]|nr:30S ribosomal protein S7 [Euryarchaeota archaeon]
MADEKPVVETPTPVAPQKEAPAAAEPKEAPGPATAPKEPQVTAPQAEVAPEQAPPKEVRPKRKIPHTLQSSKLFGKYDMTEIAVHDAGLLRYINLDPVITPHSGGRHAGRWLGKSRVSIVERIINGMMRTEEFTGKKIKAYNAVKAAFGIIAEKTKQNPVQIMVNAIERVAPREEVTRLKYGGISVPKAVDVSSARRLDVAVRNITTGAVQSSYKSTKSIEECLANELMLAAKGDMTSHALAKKEELERVASSAR